MPTSRADAWATLNEFTKNPSLIKHGLGVESAMRTYAPKYGGDPDTWGVVGLLHDYDYERYPEVGEHAIRGAEILKERIERPTTFLAMHVCNLGEVYYDFFRAEGLTAAQIAWTNTLALPLILRRDTDDARTPGRPHPHSARPQGGARGNRLADRLPLFRRRELRLRHRSRRQWRGVHVVSGETRSTL